MDSPGAELRPAWHTVRRGLGVVYVAIGCWIIIDCLKFGVFIWGFIFGRFLQSSDIFYKVVQAFQGILTLLAHVLLLIGFCRCCRAPVSSGARGFAIACVSCLILFYLGVMSLAAFMVAYPELERGGPWPATLGIVSLLSMVFFALFVSRIGRFFENHQLERNAKRWILFYLSIRLAHFSFLAVAGEPLGLPPRFPLFTVVIIATNGILPIAKILIFIWCRRLIRGAQDTIRAAQAASLPSDEVD